jgi:hypothetical protein
MTDSNRDPNEIDIIPGAYMNHSRNALYRKLVDRNKPAFALADGVKKDAIAVKIYNDITKDRTYSVQEKRERLKQIKTDLSIANYVMIQYFKKTGQWKKAGRDVSSSKICECKAPKRSSSSHTMTKKGRHLAAFATIGTFMKGYRTRKNSSTRTLESKR